MAEAQKQIAVAELQELENDDLLSQIRGMNRGVQYYTPLATSKGAK